MQQSLSMYKLCVRGSYDLRTRAAEPEPERRGWSFCLEPELSLKFRTGAGAMTI